MCRRGAFGGTAGSQESDRLGDAEPPECEDDHRPVDATTRRRQLERPLIAIDDLRRKQSLPIDGQLFELPDPELDNVRELGA